MTPGLIISFVVFGLFLVWGVVVFVRRAIEKPTEASSFYESGAAGTDSADSGTGHDGGGH